MPIISKNPYTEEVFATYPEHTKAEIEEILSTADSAFKKWRDFSFLERAKVLNKFADILDRDKERLAAIATHEMGRTITAATSEIEKCVLAIRLYTENAEKFLSDEVITSSAKKSFVRYEPLGTVLAIMPWNFPFWQVVRFLAPALMAGNTAVLKHASNVHGCAIAIEEALHKAGLPSGVFQNLNLSGGKVLEIIDDDRIKAVTITGSEQAGKEVASRAGSNIKKVVLELGGSDPFIVCADSSLEEVVPVAAGARLQNAGQTCVAAKRFLVHESLYEKFVEKLKISFEEVVMGDPMDKATILGPLSTENIRNDIAKLVEGAKASGARVLTGGHVPKMPGYFYPPTIITNVTKDMPIYHEETFGPVAVIFPFKTFEEAVEIANDTKFGLGASVWTKDMDLADKFVNKLESGCVFINQIVKSDPRLPFGGVKKSGYGRELGSHGIKEFTNIKTIYFA